MWEIPTKLCPRFVFACHVLFCVDESRKVPEKMWLVLIICLSLISFITWLSWRNMTPLINLSDPTQSANLPLHGAVSIPLHYHFGVFELEMQVGPSTIKAVLDTGSERLIVAGTNCVLNQQCVQDSGHYQPPKASSLKSSIISYGTQEDTIDWHTDHIRIIGARTDHILPCRHASNRPHSMGTMFGYRNSAPRF